MQVVVSVPNNLFELFEYQHISYVHKDILCVLLIFLKYDQILNPVKPLA